MDAQTAINKLVDNLSFQVLTGPCRGNIAKDISKNVTGTPVNVKIKLRHKDDKTNRDIFSMSKIENSNTANKLRLVNSDQTITSFNLLMESDISKKPMKKSQNKILHLFKPGVCLRTQNEDDDYTYMPESNKNKELSLSKKEDGNEKEKFALTKNYILKDEPFDDPIRRPKMFLGKCKPGGCLDPPFDEDNYSYEPVKVSQAIKEDKYPIQNSSDMIQNQLSNNAEFDKIYLRSTSPQKGSYLEKDLKTVSLITYPSNVSCKEPSLRKGSMEKSLKYKQETVPLNTNAYLQSYYIPPKSKETSVSSRSVETVENENGALYQNQSPKLTSISKDSIMPATGGPVAPILPAIIKLSPVESNFIKPQDDMGDGKTKINNEDISYNDINEPPKIFAPTLIERTKVDNENYDYIKANNLSYLQITSIHSEEKFKQLQIPITPPKNTTKSDDKEIDNQTFLRQTSKDLIKSKDIIVIAPIKKSTEINHSTENKSELNKTLCKKEDLESIDDYKNNEAIKPNKIINVNLKETNKNNRHSEDLLQLMNKDLKRISSIEINKMTDSHKEFLKIHSLIPPGGSFTLGYDDITSKIITDDSQVTYDTTTKQLLDKKDSISLSTSKGPIISSDPQQASDLYKKESKEENKFLANNNTYPLLTMRSQDYLHDKAVPSHFFGGGSISKPDEDTLTNKISISSNIDKSQIDTQQKTPSKSNIDLERHSLNSRSEFGSIYKQDSKTILTKTSKYSHENHLLRDDLNITTKDYHFVEKPDSFDDKIIDDDMTEIINKHITNNYQKPDRSIDNKVYSEPQEKLNISVIAHNERYLQNISLNNDKNGLDKTRTPLKEHSVTNDMNPVINELLRTAEFNKTIVSNSTNGSVQRSNTEMVTKRYSENGSASNGITGSIFYKDIINKKITSKEKESDKEEDKKMPKIIDNKEKDMGYLKTKRKFTKISQDLKTKIVPTQFTHKNNFENNLIHLDFAMGIIQDDNKNRLFKTFDSEILPKNTKSPLIFKSTIKANDERIKIPVDSNTNVFLQVNSNLKSTKNTLGISIASNGLSQTENKETNAHALSKINISYIMLQETMTSIYEQNLVPIETMIRELKEDIEVLVQNQNNLRQMLKMNKNKQKHVILNRRCGCYRK